MNSADAILAAATDLAARGMGKHGSGRFGSLMSSPRSPRKTPVGLPLT